MRETRTQEWHIVEANQYKGKQKQPKQWNEIRSYYCKWVLEETNFYEHEMHQP